MNLLQVTTLYPGYIADFESRHPGLDALDFGTHRELLYADAFGWSDYFVRSLVARGHTGIHLVYNYRALQLKWARENGVRASARDPFAVLKAQVSKYRPDVLFVEDCYALPPAAVAALLEAVPGIRAVACYHGVDCDIGDLVPPKALVLTCSGPLVDHWRSIGYDSHLLHHAFEPVALPPPPSPTKTTDVSFIGSCSPVTHPERHAWLCAVIGSLPTLQIWSDSFDFSLRSLRPLGGNLLRGRFAKVRAHLGSPLRGRTHRAIYGRNMLSLLAGSRVTLNRHVTQRRPAAGNMRLFEATGSGACLLTDARDDLANLFEPDSEVVTYASTPECIEKLRWLLDHPREAEAISRRGQRRTIRDHTFAQRAAQFEALLADHFQRRGPPAA